LVISKWESHTKSLKGISAEACLTLKLIDLCFYKLLSKVVFFSGKWWRGITFMESFDFFDFVPGEWLGDIYPFPEY